MAFLHSFYVPDVDIWRLRGPSSAASSPSRTPHTHPAPRLVRLSPQHTPSPSVRGPRYRSAVASLASFN